MAEDTAAASTPAVADAAQPAVERAPDAQPKAAPPTDSAPEAAVEQGAEKSNGAEHTTDDAPDATTTAQKTAPVEGETEGTGAPVDATETKTNDEAAAPEVNGTPNSAKKASNGKRKSTGGVPEHKSKLNRRKSMVRTTQLHAKPGEYYLARLRSFAPWPSIVCDEDMLPESLLTTRPVTAMRPDGTYREDYADEGKRAHERTFPVMFLQTNEFAWIPNTDLTPLDPETCKDVSEKGKSKLLIAAYGVASEGHDLKHFKELLNEHQRAMEQEEEEREAQAAAKAAAQAERDAKKKKKRKSTDMGDGADEMDVDNVDEDSKSKGSKKRKKDADADAESDKSSNEFEQPAKTPKTTQKLKLTTPKPPAAETSKKTPGTGKTKAKAKAGAKKADDDEEAVEEAKEEKPVEKQIDPQAAKVKKEKEVLYIRHRLQKGFISRDQPPKEEEMTAMSGYFAKLEAYDEVEVSIIRLTKINKVLRMIVKLSSIPRDEEFNFRRRAIDILSKWKTVLDSDTAATPAAEDKEKDVESKAGAATTNGVAHKDEDDVETASTPAKTEGGDEKTEEPAAAEPVDQPMPDAEPSAKEQAPVDAPAEEKKEKEEEEEKEAIKEEEAAAAT
ncbi:hypothetical protein ASPZODRAFT_142875 [Penicilliopsis zonata CBS 506.65]|uniref:PWWP domain-containing protein n=1 Tax=Penicilliopsis zonata CBS 506.65 TaxID=1073090 RepID=A0A1L9SGS2_9EURO|nr:hypothetical protein ASPZODRAFT_142875 [Penicilliopsis zonata CBS 506.65]OJJ46254.1 hypothetical protein ASPZODRAFT_142875 [Penicilliopsis zonata CBS 506.65]